MDDRSSRPDVVGHDPVDVVGHEPVRMPRGGWPVLALSLAGALAVWVSTQDEPSVPGPEVAAAASVAPSPSASVLEPEPAPLDACREVILAINSLTEASLGTFPPSSASALASVEQTGQAIAQMRVLLRPAEQRIADDASEAINAMILGDVRTNPLGTLRAASPALASACTS